MTNAQYEYITGLQYENQHLKKEVENFRNGIAFQKQNEQIESLRSRHARTEKQMQGKISKLEEELHRESAKVRHIWFEEVLPDVQKCYDRQLKEERKKREAAEARALKAEAKASEERAKKNQALKEKYALALKLEQTLDENRELQRRLNQNHRNSGKPSSMEAPWENHEEGNTSDSKAQEATVNTQTSGDSEQSEKPAAQKKGSHQRNGRTDAKGTRPRGNRPGNFQGRLQRETPDEVVELIPQQVQDHPEDWKKTGNVTTRQKKELKCEKVVTDYEAPEYINVRTGEKIRAEFPAGVNQDVNYGSMLKAVALYLMLYMNCSQNKVKTFLSEITGGELQVSEGLLSNLSLQFHQKAAEDIERIRKLLRAAPWVAADFTGAKLDGELHCIGVCAYELYVLYSYTRHKGKEAADALPLAEFDGSILSDCESIFRKYGTAWQVCLAHILRELLESIESEPDKTWNAEMRKFLQELIRDCQKILAEIPEEIRAQAALMTEEQIEEIMKKYHEILDLGREQYEYDPPTWYTKGRALRNRLEERAEDVLYFLRHADMPWTNNICERLLRIWVRKRRSAIVFHSPDHVRACCSFLSFVETRRRHNRNIFADICSVFDGTLQPLEA